MTIGRPRGSLGWMQHSGVSLFSAILGAIVAYFVGYGYAVVKRANKDYKFTKGAVPTMRKTFWSSVGTLVKASAVALALLAVLAAWVVRDVQDGRAPTSLVPAPSAPAERQR